MNATQPRKRTKDRYFTSGQVAEHCGVSPRVVNKWFDAGILTGWRMPNSGDRRIDRKSVLAFMKERNISTDSIPKAEPIVLVVSPATTLGQGLTTCLRELGDYEVIQAMNTFEAGGAVASLAFDVLVIDFAIGRGEAVHIMRHVKSRPNSDAACIGIVGEDESDPQVYTLRGEKGLCFDAIHQQPVDVEAVADAIEVMLSEVEG